MSLNQQIENLRCDDAKFLEKKSDQRKAGRLVVVSK